MEQETAKVPRVRRTQAQIEQILEAFSKSDLQITPFCAQHKVTNSTFHKWQSRYGKRGGKVKESNFAKLKIAAPASEHRHLFAEVHGIRFYQPVTASFLKELIAR